MRTLLRLTQSPTPFPRRLAPLWARGSPHPWESHSPPTQQPTSSARHDQVEQPTTPSTLPSPPRIPSLPSSPRARLCTFSRPLRRLYGSDEPPRRSLEWRRASSRAPQHRRGPSCRTHQASRQVARQAATRAARCPPASRCGPGRRVRRRGGCGPATGRSRRAAGQSRGQVTRLVRREGRNRRRRVQHTTAHKDLALGPRTRWGALLDLVRLR